MWTSIVILLVLVFFITRFRAHKRLNYKSYVLTLPESKQRQNVFMENFNHTVPLEVIHGVNTKTVEGAREYEHLVDPVYMEKALEMHYDPTVERPDITYFNLGAIGAMVGHLKIQELAKKQGVKYALVFEDNVVIEDDQIFDEVEEVIRELGDDFEVVFFHCISRMSSGKRGTLEKVRWISSMKCYLVHVDNMLKYHQYFYPMNNHVDNKHEDLIARGARIFYKDMRHCISIDRSGGSTIGHSDHGKGDFFSRQYPEVSSTTLREGW